MYTLTRHLKVYLLAASFVMLSSCGGGGGGGGNSASGVGSNGGSVTSSDGTVKVQVPAGALSSNVAIAVSPATGNAPQGSIGTVVELSPDGTVFSQPVTVTVKYDPALIPQGVAESSLTIAYLSGSDWVDLPTTVDTVNKTLTAQTTHFSIYAVVINDAAKSPYGTLIGQVNGVNVYSNGCIDPSVATAKCMAINGGTYPDTSNTSNAGGYNSGLQWQCVEFINRYYYQIYNKDIKVGGGNAQDYWSLASTKGLVAYPNAGSVAPQVGDIIVSTGISGNVGHVAIVWKIEAGKIHLVEQNWHEGAGDIDHVLSLSSGNKVEDFSASYPVTGWLRLPTSQTIVFQPGSEGFDTVYGTVYAAGPNGNAETLYDGGWADYYYDYFMWDLSSLPPTANVKSVLLYLYFNASGNDPAFQIQRVTSSWDESSLTRSNHPTSVAWGSWTGIVNTGWYTLDITELYTNWKDGTWPNYGIVLVPTANNNTNGYIISSDYKADPALRPKLVITTQ